MLQQAAHQTGLRAWQQQGPQLGAEQGPPRGGFVARLDRDGDGKVSCDEFDGPPAHFDLLDRNGDGYLSEEERPAVPPRRR